MAEDVKNVEAMPSMVEDEKTFKRNKWLFTIPGIGRDMLYTLVSTYFLQYVQFGVTLTVAQFATISLLIGILGRIWDGINDPMMGAIIDGSHLKWGKFKPWILIGAILDGLLTVLLFTLKSQIFSAMGGWFYVILICAVYLLWEAAFTMNDIGYWSMIPSLSRTKERRNKLTSLTVFFAGIGTILMTGLVTLFSPGNVVDAYALYSVIACLVVIIGQAVTAFGVKEAPVEEKKDNEGISFKRMVKIIIHNKQLLWISLAQLFSAAAVGILLGLIYNLYYMECGYNGDIFYFVVVYAICNVLLQVFYPKLADKFGRKKLQLYSMITMGVGFVGMLIIGWSWCPIPINIATICVFAVLIFGGYTIFYTAEVINLNNCVEYNDYISGSRDEAVVTTMRPLIVKFGDAIKYGIVTLTLISSGLYNLTQNVSAIESQTSMFDKKVTTVDAANGNVDLTLDYVTNYKLVVAANGNVEAIEAIVDNSKALTETLFDYTYTDAVGEMYLARYETNGEKPIDVIKLNDAGSIAFVVSGYTYKLEINPNTGDKSLNAADVIYNNRKTTSTRVLLRLFAIGIPGLLMFLSWLVQRKKFIIDEEFFDKMLVEIDQRDKEKI